MLISVISLQAKKKCTTLKGTLSADSNVCVIKTESTDSETVSMFLDHLTQTLDS
jgi:hypothetical protein